MKISKSTILIILLSIFTHCSFAQNTGTLIVEIESCRNDDGLVAVALHNGEEGFPGSKETMVQAATAKIINGKAVVEFKDLTYGEYAISAFHDENSNTELDTNWIGISKEGVGASNNAKGKMGPPKYEDARF
jgi:uncharacterized protein (DUF2141 family)